MFEAKLTIEVPDLAAAINRLADAIAHNLASVAVPSSVSANPAPETIGAAATATPAQPMGAPVPVAPTAAFNASPANTAIPAAASNIPLAPPPTYTHNQIMAAGAMLMDAGRMNDLMNLLHSFGVQAVADLKPEQLGAFATALRNLGVKI